MQLPPLTVILCSTSTTNIHITTRVLRDLISYSQKIHRKLLVLSLESLCHKHNSSYLDPSFFPDLDRHNWHRVSNRFSPRGQGMLAWPSITAPSICIPIQIHRNNWAAVCRRIIQGIPHFYHADNLNSSSIEDKVKAKLFFSQHMSHSFCPPESVWVNCENVTFTPHSNECGPRIILALAIMMSHPSPNSRMLLPYFNANLAQHLDEHTSTH